MYFGMGVDCGSRTYGAVGLAERRTVGAVGAVGSVGAVGAIGAIGLAEHRTVGAGCPLTDASRVPGYFFSHFNFFFSSSPANVYL